MAQDYYNNKSTRGINIRINDMSLQWGGLFDVWNNWSSSPGHNRHRVGKSADIDRNALGSDGKSVKVDQAKLDSYAKKRWGLDRITEPPRVKCDDCIHYESPD